MSGPLVPGLLAGAVAVVYGWGAAWAYEFARVRGLAAHVLLAQAVFAVAYRLATGAWYGLESLLWALYSVAAAAALPLIDRWARSMVGRPAGTLPALNRLYRALPPAGRAIAEAFCDMGLELPHALAVAEGLARSGVDEAQLEQLARLAETAARHGLGPNLALAYIEMVMRAGGPEALLASDVVQALANSGLSASEAAQVVQFMALAAGRKGGTDAEDRG